MKSLNYVLLLIKWRIKEIVILQLLRRNYSYVKYKNFVILYSEVCFFSNRSILRLLKYLNHRDRDIQLIYFDEIQYINNKQFYLAKPAFSPIFLSQYYYLGNLIIININNFDFGEIKIRNTFKDIANYVVIEILRKNYKKIFR